MNLKSAKIVVVDDKREEVEKLLKLLDREGISFNYYFEGGDLRNLPKKPLKNVRLVFLDFVLGTDGQNNNTKIATLLNVLEKILDKENGPYAIFAWTKHNGKLIAPFKAQILGKPNIPKPVAIIDMDKKSIMRSVNAISEKLKVAFNGEDVFEVLLEWEHHGHAALASVLRALVDISGRNIPATGLSLDQYSSQLRRAIEKNMYQFANSVSGKNLNSGNSILIDSQLPLTGILQDHLETNIRKLTPALKRLSGKIYRLRNGSSYTVEEKAQMNNYFLLTSDQLESSPRPGNIYKASAIHGHSKLVLKKAIFFDVNKMRVRRTDPVVGARVKELNKKGISLLIEITPECDYVQKNWKGAKFAFGVLLPHKFSSGQDTKDYLRSGQKLFPPLLIKYRAGIYYLTLHSDYQIMLPFSSVKSIRPILRARKEMLIDIQHWLASHASRPGKTEFK